jgi:iron complex outermembrane recepter protein
MSRQFKTWAVTGKNNRCIALSSGCNQERSHMFKTTPIHRATVLAFGAALASTPWLAAAQDAPAAQRIEITGSNIKRIDAETASPVQVISRDEIERTGKQSIQEVLRGLTGDNSGSIPTSFTGGFAAGSAAVSLRGLGVNSTLVLVNGRRMATYGLADDGARSFVDLNTIPLELVERVEVLKDGASAIYGSDAVGGVVNIILRKEYRGATLGSSYGQSSRGDGKTARAFVTGGFGDLSAERYNLFASLEATKQQAITASDRGFIGQDDLRSIGFFDGRRGSYPAGGGLFPDGSGPFFSATNPFGTVRVPGGTQSQRINLTPCPEINPATGVCTFNTKIYDQVQPATERLNLFTRGNLQIDAATTAYAEAGVFLSRTRATGTPGGVNDNGVFNPADPANPLVTHTTILPAAHPDNPTGVDRTLSLMTADLGGRNQETKNRVTRLVAGVQGSAFDWDYDIGLAHIRSDLTDTQTGFVRHSVLQAAIDDGSYRVNRPDLVPQSVRDAISPELTRKPKSSVSLLDVKASRELWALPGGRLGVAVGAELRQEKTDTPPVPFTDTSDIVGLGFSAFNSKRNVKALYGEVTAPLTKWLQVDAAVRTDRYSDYGSSTTPRLGVKIKPIEALAIRGSYSESFRAPGPTESGNSSSLGFTSIAIVTIGDPSVKPETAKSFNLGVVYEPFAGTSATVDFYRIERKSEIVPADPVTILGDAVDDPALANQRVAGRQPNSFIYYNDDGAISAVSGPYVNAAGTKTDGVDVELRHRLNLGAAGKLTGQLFWTHVNSFKRTLADGSSFEYAGTHGPIVLSSGAGTPKDKATLSLTFERADWALTGAFNYVGPLRMIDHKGQTVTQRPDGTFEPDDGLGNHFFNTDGTSCSVYYPDGSARGCKLPSFTTLDLFARWSPVKHWDINVSVQNLFDRKAPFDPYQVVSYATNYNQAWHQSGAVGRFFTVGAKYSF